MVGYMECETGQSLNLDMAVRYSFSFSFLGWLFRSRYKVPEQHLKDKVTF